MNSIQKRFLLFLIGCIGTRSLFVIIAKQININYLSYLGYLSLIPAFGFIYILLDQEKRALRYSETKYGGII